MYNQGTVCFIRHKDKILLALIEYSPKIRKWNGIGGYVEEGEALEEAVAREAWEETYIKLLPMDLKKVAEIPHVKFILNVFIAERWGGEIKIKETDTVKDIRWFDIENLPYDKMHEDNKYWLPKVLSGKLIRKVGGRIIEVDTFD